MTMTKVGAAAPLGSQTTTTFQLGTYNSVTDTFTSSIDLNDQVTYFLKPGRGGSPNPKFEQKSTAVRADNVRAHGSLVVKDHLDNVTCTAVFTIKATTPQGVSDAWNAVAKFIKRGGACLRFAWPQSSAYSYLDIQYAAVTTPPGSPLEMQAKASTGLVIAMEGSFAWRWDRLTYQNLAWNPGFEAPSGPGVQVFADAFANVNAYSVQAGGTPTTAPSNTYTDIVYANIPASGALLRYYRLGLGDSGTTSLDISGNAQAGTTHGSPTMAVAGLISGDTDTCYTFAGGSSQYVSIPSTGLPIGNAAMSLTAWIKDAASPGGLAVFWGYGDTTTNHHTLQALLDTSNKVAVNVGGSTLITTAAGLTTGVAHFVAVTWDGTTLTLNVDNAVVGTATPGAQAIPASPTVNLGATSAPNSFFTGQVDEACIYSGVLSAGQITNLYNAGNTGATGTLSNAMSVPAAARVAFGSPAWGAVNVYQQRFRYTTSQINNFYLHRTDANNYMLATIQSGANGFKLQHDVASSVTTVAQATVPLQHEAWYWLQVTQFPTVAGNPPYLQAVLSYDSAGAVGTAIATLAGLAADAVTAQIGAPQLNPTGAALVVGGVSSGAGNAVNLFGPGAWQFTALQGSATCSSAASWDGSIGDFGMSGNGTMYPGTVTSKGAARVDLGPTGTVDCQWYLYNGTTSTLAPAGLWTLPVSSTPATIQVNVKVKTSGLGVACVSRIDLYEYTSAGVYLRTSAVTSLTGNTAGGAWQTLSGSATTGASTAYVGVVLRVVDTNSGASANGIVQFDNVLIWDQTATATASMDYCELRFPQSPAALFVTGVQGQIAADALAEVGMLFSSWGSSATVSLYLGRRAVATTAKQFISNTPNGNAFGTFVLDSTAYGGFRWSEVFPEIVTQNSTKDAQGISHWMVRSQLTSVSGGAASAAGLYSAVWSMPALLPGAGIVNSSVGNPTSFPWSALSTWTLCDFGQVIEPATPNTTLADVTQTYTAETLTDPGATTVRGVIENYAALLPVDGNLVTAKITNNNGTFTNKYLYVYFDPGIPGGPQSVGSGAVANSTELGPLPNPGHAVGSTASTAGVNLVTIATGAESGVQLDPTAPQYLYGLGGTQQFVLLAADGATAACLPVTLDLVYTPLSLYAR